MWPAAASRIKPLAPVAWSPSFAPKWRDFSGRGLGMKILALALMCAAAAMPASAMDFSGLLDGGYANISGGGANSDGYLAGGKALVDFGGGLGVQGNLDYQKQSLSGISVKDTGFGGDAFWRGGMFKLGGSVRYDDLSTSLPFPSDHVTSYGGFGEVYLGNRFTLKGKAGGTSGAFSGSYYGAAAEFYVTRHIAIEPVYQYQDMGALLGHTSSYGGVAELFVSSRLPLAIMGGYSHSKTSGVGIDQFTLTLSWRLGADRDFISWDRSGPTRWNGGLDFL
jgi:hypothetical protein